MRKIGGYQAHMSLRDYFAAKAMEGWLSTFGDDHPHPAQGDDGWRAETIAKLSYALADAMLKARGDV